MTTVRIQHRAVDFDTWKATFDSDPVGRERVGVRAYRIGRGVDDPNFVTIDLDFDDTATAAQFKDSMERIWQTPHAGSILASSPELRIVEQAESVTY
jgi:hypothetical protein